jgi:uroporphyrinogen decarboxylase
LARVRGAPRIHFTRDTMPFLHLARQTGADVIGLDWRADVAYARKVLGADLPIQGNLDPLALYGPGDTITAKVHAICDAAGPVGHVFNLGHGVTPKTPISGVEAMIAAVKSRRNP